MLFSEPVSDSINEVDVLASSVFEVEDADSCTLTPWVTCAETQSVFPDVEAGPVGLVDSVVPGARWDAIGVPTAVDGPKDGSIWRER